MKDRVFKIIPKHARKPLLFILIFHFACFYMPHFLVDDARRVDLSLPIDEAIPFLPVFICFYVAAYIQWFASYIYHCCADRDLCTRLFRAEVGLKLSSALIFIIFPTVMVRPELGSSFFDSLVSIIYFLDKPINLFPSLHCAASWLCFRSACALGGASRKYILFQLFFTVLVCASTVFIKQHLIIDIPAGIILAELLWQITRFLPSERIFFKSN
jgi:membrane-associated phospholipid phosphatase